MVETVVTKSAFAAMKGRDPSAVSRWIAEGKISAAALKGTGVRARIIVERAERDLAGALDFGQQLAQDRPVLPLADAPGIDANRGEPRDVSADDHLTRRRVELDLERRELENAQARRRAAVDEGRWIAAADARQAWGQELTTVLAEVETFIGGVLARELAARHGLDWKALSVEIRDLWRGHRRDAAERARGALDGAEAADAGDQA